MGTSLRAWLVVLGVIGLAARGAKAQEPPPALNLMPTPASVQPESGSLPIDASFSVALTGYTEPRLERSVDRFLHQVERQTGIPRLPDAAASGSIATLVVRTDHASKSVQEVGEDESYSLEVTPTGAKLMAATPLGAMHGLQTFLQLIEISSSGFVAPAVKIHDQPRFAWRGLMIDVARHFVPLDILKRNIDGMEAVKMNVFHWHLSENQGFRAESKRFPKLQQLGSSGMYYTQAEMRELVAYARDRGIRVVPEFDMPGHSTAWFVSHPELASGKGAYQIETKWGVFDPAMDPTNEKVYKFIDALISEMAKIFPDQFFHIGGDEVNGKEWDANPKIQSFMKQHAIVNNAALQTYFSGRVQKLVAKHGKTMIGWDEVLVPGVPKDIVIQSWRGQASLAQAAKQGYLGILSSGYYLDLGWSAARHFAVDPVSGNVATLTAEEQQRILGGESCMWSEYVNAENIDSRIWPRNAAIAERLWSPQSIDDAASMYVRLEVESARLEWLGLRHRSYYQLMLERIAGPSATHEQFAALKTLSDVIEPVKDYTRARTAPAPATSATPLRRVVDAIPLESDRARHFNNAVDTYLGSACKDRGSFISIQSQLTTWRDNDARLHPLAARSFLVSEVTATSQDLSALAAVGLAALDSLERGESTAADQKASQDVILQESAKPKAQLLILPLSAVQKLVDAAARNGCALGR